MARASLEHPADDDAGDEPVLDHILGGTRSGPDEECFARLVQHAARAVGATHALLLEAAQPAAGHGRVVATYGAGLPEPGQSLSLAGSASAAVNGGVVLEHARGVRLAFPADALLDRTAADGYLGVPLTDRAGAPLGVLAAWRPTDWSSTARRRLVLEIFAARAAAELERERVEAQLRASERQFRDLFEEAPIAYVYEDTDTRFVSANRAFVELLGLQPDKVRGTVGRTLLAPTSETRGRIDDAFADIQRGKERGRIEIELRRQDDGKPVFAQFWSRPEPDGKHTRTMLIDITERVLAERERNRLQQQNSYLQEEIRAAYDFEEIIGETPALKATLAKVLQVASTTSTVLILGETGSGKELIARALHGRSPRRDRPFIKLNCAALPTGLIESELFGHEKGAFTGALAKRVGRFALADGGTIFLDEIGDMPLDVQVRLLRVLQEHEFEPVGSPKTIRVDVRVIAATNKDLAQAVAAGGFRADLYYRLNVFPIEVPALRQRRDDVPLLAHYFLNRYATKIGKRIDGIAPATMARLVAYHWPGNIRELENVIERAVILAHDALLEVDAGVLEPLPRTPADGGDDGPRIRRALEECRWVIEGPKGAAQALGLHPNTLRSRMKRLGITRGQA